MPQFVYTRRTLMQTLAGLAAADLLRSQDATFSSDVKVINLFATVRNSNGEIVRNLNKEDFVLQEDGRPQRVTYVSRESNLPLTIGFVVDTSQSTKKILPDERAAARTFIDQVVREDKDQGFVLHFDREVELLRDLTHSRPKLQKALDLLQTAEREREQERRRDDDPDTRGGMGRYPGSGRGGGWPGSPGGGGRRGGGRPSGEYNHHGGSKLYDAVLLSSDELMKKQKGRKALIVLSDGADSGSKSTMRSAISSAQRSDSLIYTLFFKDNEPDGKRVMEQLASETGGAMIPVTGREPVDKAFAQIGEELRSQYSLGYSSDSKSNDGGFRKIALTTKQPGLVIQTRDGYWADGDLP